MKALEIVNQLQEVICDIDSAQSYAFDKREPGIRFNEIRINCGLAHVLLDELECLINKERSHEQRA